MRRLGRAAAGVLCGMLALMAAGCHRNNLNSGYGIAWVSLTSEPGNFASYVVNVDSLEFTRSDSYVASAGLDVETVDFAKLSGIEEMWGSASIPVGTYTSATLVLDYTSTNPGTNISVMVNGVPQKATVVSSTGAAVTTETITIVMDPAYPLVIQPTYATTAAQRVAIDFNLAASTQTINLKTSPATVAVRPYLTAAIAPADNKLIRVRGPLINSSIDLGTYTVYIRPFYDDVYSMGSLSLFTDANTLYTINGEVKTGSAGVSQLSQSSAGATLTAAYTTYEPTATPSATAGIFHAKYVIAGGTLEDAYTQGLEGEVIARSGNTLTLRGATFQEYDTTPLFEDADATVIVGPSTIVTADDSTATGLTYQSIAVGQHIAVRGLCNSSCTSPITLDATNSKTNTGLVRLLPTQLFGSLAAQSTGGVTLDLQAIDGWPVSNYQFAGNGTSSATDPVAASFAVNTGSLTIPAVVAPGNGLFIDGLVAPFGSAPPAFNATSINSELTVQTAGAATGGLTCGQGNADCVPASLYVTWTEPGGASAPFTSLSATGMTIDLSNSALKSAVISIGPETIDLVALGSSPQILPTAVPATVTATASAAGSVAQVLPPVFLPSYAYGNPLATAPAGINVFSSFSTFATNLPGVLASTPALQMQASGTYNRATNTFNAVSVAVVL